MLLLMVTSAARSAPAGAATLARCAAPSGRDRTRTGPHACRYSPPSRCAGRRAPIPPCRRETFAEGGKCAIRPDDDEMELVGVAQQSTSVAAAHRGERIQGLVRVELVGADQRAHLIARSEHRGGQGQVQ